jgi:ASC-1-like (ASCH) protein
MENWQILLRSVVIPQLRGDRFWDEYLDKALYDDVSPMGIHLAIFIEPYLSYVIEGKKTVESRFGVRRNAPYGKVASGDIILLKRSGGPVVGLCKVSNVWYYKLTEDSWKKLRKEFTNALCAQDPVFWENRASAEFATLMQISFVKPIEPITYEKNDRRGWVVLRSPMKADRFYI